MISKTLAFQKLVSGRDTKTPRATLYLQNAPFRDGKYTKPGNLAKHESACFSVNIFPASGFVIKLYLSYKYIAGIGIA